MAGVVGISWRRLCHILPDDSSRSGDRADGTTNDADDFRNERETANSRSKDDSDFVNRPRHGGVYLCARKIGRA